MAQVNEVNGSAFHNHSGSQFIGTSICSETVNIGGESPLFLVFHVVCCEPLANNTSTVADISRDDQEEQLLARLPYAESATFNHYRWQGESRCLPGTRAELLGEIMSWARGDDGPDNEQRIFWLDGMAGMGKSTVARTIARSCSDDGRLGASFFFSRGGGELETARMFVTTIARQLAQRHRLLREGVCAAVRESPDVAKLMLSDQWRKLVLGPCAGVLRAHGHEALPAALPPMPLPLVVVVDALDECKAPSEVELVLALLSETAGFAVAPLKIFLTSRPEITIRAGLQNMSRAQRRHVILHHVEPSIVSRDIAAFFAHSLAALIPSRPLLSGFRDEEVFEQLVQRADGLFIWAATTCRFIKEGGPLARRRLDTIIRQRISPAATGPERKLDDIYTSVLRSALREQWTADETEQFCRSMNEVLGAIAVLFSSLSAPSLAALLSCSEIDVLDMLGDLHSILDVPVSRNMPIRPHHASVRDFLLSRQRCSDTRFRVDEHQAHTRIARHCLLLMAVTLKRDICGLKDPGVTMRKVARELVAAGVPPSLRYACLYWVQHLQKSHDTQALEELVSSFMQQHFLLWLEVLALIGRLSDGVEMLVLLKNIFVSLLYPGWRRDSANEPCSTMRRRAYLRLLLMRNDLFSTTCKWRRKRRCSCTIRQLFSRRPGA